MKIIVRHNETTVIVDRPNFADYHKENSASGSAWRDNMMNDTVIPTLNEAVKKIKELHELKQL